jgi:hypothetical protein
VTSANDTDVCQPDGDGGVILLAREGDGAPTLPVGASFANFGAAEAPVINAGGDVAFAAGLTVGQGGVTSANDRGLFFADAEGNLSLVLREGELITVAPGDVRTLQDFSLGFDTLNDARQIAVLATFANMGNAILLVTVPEPSSVLLLAFGLAGLAASRRGRFV